MPRTIAGLDNWRRDAAGLPDWIPDDLLPFYPGSGGGVGLRDWIPDPEAEPEVVITPEQERYGIHWKPGDPQVEPNFREIARKEQARLKREGKTSQD